MSSQRLPVPKVGHCWENSPQHEPRSGFILSPSIAAPYKIKITLIKCREVKNDNGLCSQRLPVPKVGHCWDNSPHHEPRSGFILCPSIASPYKITITPIKGREFSLGHSKKDKFSFRSNYNMNLSSESNHACNWKVAIPTHTSIASVSYKPEEIESSKLLPYLFSKESCCLSSPFMAGFSSHVAVYSSELVIPSENSTFGRFHLLLRCSRMLSFPPVNSKWVLSVPRHCRTGSMYPCKASQIICFRKFL